jgi:hypothetical protein
MKIKYITITCEKYHFTRVQSIRDTWGKNQDVLFLSDINISPDVVGFDYLRKGYDNIWMKYREIIKNWTDFKYDWYFFTDDDTFVNVKNINNLLSNYSVDDKICLGVLGVLNADATDRDGNYTGFPLHTIQGNQTELPLTYASGGAGFILSLESMKTINKYLNTIQDVPRCYNSDVTIGFWIRNSGIKNINTKGFWWTHPTELQHDVDVIKESYTYHYVDEKMMHELFNICNDRQNRVLRNAEYGTHMTPLIAAVMNTRGPIFEMGCGDYSTPILHAICLAQKRYVLSTDTSKEWLNLFRDMESEIHRFEYVPVYSDDWQQNPRPEMWDGVGNQKWSVVFIDHRPGERRKFDILRFENDAEIIVVHDTETSSYGYEPILDRFRYRYNYIRYAVRTTLVSNKIDVEKLF